jgi:hypothetical protein
VSALAGPVEGARDKEKGRRQFQSHRPIAVPIGCPALGGRERAAGAARFRTVEVLDAVGNGNETER